MVYSTPSGSSTNDQQRQFPTTSITDSNLHDIGDSLAEGEVIRIELYEEVSHLNRETVVRERVRVTKILVQESADLQP